ncbi:MAG: bifunctional molybdenum cofactor biosynthesis protein MoaC/MoaB [Ferruginibacter sp.]
MVNITHKQHSLRKAVATAIVNVSLPATIAAIIDKTVPKGDVFEFARAAGLLAIKKTSDVIPDCHPLPVEYAAITYEMNDMQVQIRVEVQTIYKTGVEVEAMHGAAITALTMYDMLKPIDKNVEISTIRLISKEGGKTDYAGNQNKQLRIAVIVCSDSISAGKTQDLSGKLIKEKISNFELDVENFEIIPDDIEQIQSKLKQLARDEFDLVLLTGGTGLSARDVTPEALKPLIEREVPGISELMRSYGQQRMPYAMLSRSVSGFINKSLVIAMPGSPKAAEETMDALFPHVLHVFKVALGERHE